MSVDGICGPCAVTFHRAWVELLDTGPYLVASFEKSMAPASEMVSVTLAAQVVTTASPSSQSPATLAVYGALGAHRQRDSKATPKPSPSPS